MVDKSLLIFIGSIALAVIVVAYGPVILASQHESLFDRLITAQDAANVRGNITQTNFNNLLENINSTVAEVLEHDANLTKQETEDLVEVIRGSAQIIPIVNESLTDLNHTLSEQLLPVIATLELQQKAETAHFNQTATILDSIQLSGNATRIQAEQINQSRDVQ